ncbi:MAG: hypothetical protein KDJ22_00750 [Candidatus Competibacteraceae bacterium]|nr:hypothetical protein [Candidatus Competibacteraceae bacterium]MCP5125435.1 hypothetical protein [Gammaproteobacteria bacterium]HRX69596.1 hypothetical protein [Candidatus Competibacteraceae bacterium]
MTEDEQRASDFIAACAKEVSAYILRYADEAGLERSSFLVSVAAVLASSALAAQPEDQLGAASRHIQNALGLIHCLRDEEADNPMPAAAANAGFTAPQPSP